MKKILTDLFKSAIHNAFGDSTNHCDPQIQISSRKDFGDYQANFAMRLAKQLQKKPFDIATAVIEQLQHNPIFKKLEPSGPGFINIFLAENFIEQQLQAIAIDKRLGIQPVAESETVVIDYASANVAKEMHVGHIRSIVIGDAIFRLLDFLGHHAIRQSHIGDWGTQFGMLIEYLIENPDQASHTVSDLDLLYKKAKQQFDADPIFADYARARVVSLQSGDAETIAIWNQLVEKSLHYFQQIYSKLDVLVTKDDARGESYYNPMLKETVEELITLGLTEISDDALVIFLENHDTPFIIRKKDGGYLYATTDLAAAKFRMETLKANRIIYLTDARQRQHFAMLFDSVKKAGWAKEVRLEHIPFGAILGQDNKPFKTRSGESIKLISLLEEAEHRALAIVRNKNPEMSGEEQQHIAHHIGIGALKYADLRADKVKDYVFDWDKLLAFEGNTAPYLQNAYVRIQAIFRKGQINLEQIRQVNIRITTVEEHALAIKLLNFSSVLYSVADNLSLHSLCDYLYDLAATFHQFYEHCPILSAKADEVRDSRLLLSDITARTLELGLHLLGINTVKKM